MSTAALVPATRDPSGDDAWQLLPRTAKRARRTLEGVIGIPGTEGNRVGALRKGGEISSAMPESIGGAEHTTTSATVSARQRSLHCDEEINLVVIGPRIVRALDNHFDTDRERSVRIEARCWTRRSLRQHLAERLIAPLRRVS
jgi:hypothetical protein